MTIFRLVRPSVITTGTILVLVILFKIGIPFIDVIELKTLDLRFQVRGAQEPSSAVVLALIDEKSLDAEGRWPWPRSRIARLVDQLSSDGAKVLGFDIAFIEPDEHARLTFIRDLRAKVESLEIDDPSLKALLLEEQKAQDHDLALARAISEASSSVVLGYFFHMRKAELEFHLDRHKVDAQLKDLGRSKYPSVVYTAGQVDQPPFIQAYAPESNLPLLARSAESSGYFTLTADQDGVVRWLPLALQCGQDVFPPLAVLCAWHYLGRPQLFVRVASYGLEGIQIGQRVVPTDEKGQMLVNYLGPPGTFPSISVSDILQGHYRKGFFSNKVVLIGSSAVGVAQDLRSTPLSAVSPGVEIHAAALDNIVTGRTLTKPQWSRIFDIMAIVVLGTVTGIAIPRMSAIRGLFFGAGLIIGYVLLTHWLFAHGRIWLNLVYPVLAVSANHTYLTVYQYLTEERERKKIKNAFSQYTPPEVIEEVLKDPKRLKLGGEEKVLTVLFSDIEGFTTYSENYSPTQMIDILSEYFARMTEDIFRFQGTLADYIGDELMAVYGAPLKQEDHARRACASALAMREHLLKLQRDWEEKGRPSLRARTGINSGPMLVGNLGSKYRFAYGVLGDQVNLASRLETLNKVYKTDILLGEATASSIGPSFRVREVDWVRVLGRTQGVGIFELISESGLRLPQGREDSLALYAQGLQAYRRHDWSGALHFFSLAGRSWPEDAPSRIMAARCRTFVRTPPPVVWDCVFDQTAK